MLRPVSLTLKVSLLKENYDPWTACALAQEERAADREWAESSWKERLSEDGQQQLAKDSADLFDAVLHQARKGAFRTVRGQQQEKGQPVQARAVSFCCCCLIFENARGAGDHHAMHLCCISLRSLCLPRCFPGYLPARLAITPYT